MELQSMLLQHGADLSQVGSGCIKSQDVLFYGGICGGGLQACFKALVHHEYELISAGSVAIVSFKQSSHQFGGRRHSHRIHSPPLSMP